MQFNAKAQPRQVLSDGAVRETPLCIIAEQSLCNYYRDEVN